MRAILTKQLSSPDRGAVAAVPTCNRTHCAQAVTFFAFLVNKINSKCQEGLHLNTGFVRSWKTWISHGTWKYQFPGLEKFWKNEPIQKVLEKAWNFSSQIPFIIEWFRSTDTNLYWFNNILMFGQSRHLSLCSLQVVTSVSGLNWVDFVSAMPGKCRLTGFPLCPFHVGKCSLDYVFAKFKQVLGKIQKRWWIQFYTFGR